MKVLVIILFIMLWNALHIVGQTYQRIDGVVLNKADNKPLVNANIYLKNHFIGTTSNKAGEFIIQYPEKYSNDTLMISFLGFQSQHLPLSTIRDSMLVKLLPQKFHLHEITVKHNDPKWIIKKALDHIANNYFEKPLQCTAFYREIAKENTEEIQFAEAVLEIYKGNTTKNGDKDQVKLIKGRKKQNVKPSVLWHYLKFVDGPYDLLKSDVVKNKNDFFTVSQNKFNFLHPRYFKYYDYTLMESIDIDNAIYAIQFKPKRNKKWVIYDGIIFIDKASFAIRGMEYKFNVNRVNQAKIVDFSTQQALDKAGAIIKAVVFYCLVTYKQYKNKWVLSRATMNYNFVFNETIQRDLMYITSHSSMTITAISETKVEKIPFKEQMKYRSALHENITSFDPDFWENYNYVHYEKRKN